MTDRRDESLAVASRLPSPRVLVPAVDMRQQGVNVFHCPVCGNEFRQDDEYEPSCSGPGALDSHPLAVMSLQRVDEPRKLILAR